jgi:16S rRNA (cytidine1402-2'-O)-methyltransferase
MAEISNPAAGKLYLVPTPIGNLEDITLRAIRVLKEANLVLCEDTRRAAILFQKYNILTPKDSYHEHNKFGKTPGLLERIKQGQVIAQISEAGTPGISDPGFYLARAAIVALVGSGLPTDRFIFEGFLPAKKGRKSRLDFLKDDPRTLIFFEAPHRIQRTVNDLLMAFGDRRAAYGRELTKIHEEFRRGTLSELAADFDNREPRGEYTLVVEGNTRRWKSSVSEQEGED